MHGGAEVQVFLLASELKRRGHDVTLVSMRDPEAFEPELMQLGIPLYSLTMQRGVGDPRALFRLARVVRECRPDVVHSHMVHANLLSRLSRLLVRIPVQISTAHNFSEGARWREIAYRLTDALCDLTTNVCVRCVEHFVEVGAAPKHRIRYMPNGLDVQGFERIPGVRAAKRSELGVPGDSFLWLAVGRLEEQKDYPNLLAAVKRLLETGDAPEFRVVVAGAGSLEASLRARATELGIEGSTLQFLGERKDVVELMAAADGFVMSSAWEGLPMVLLESGAACLPAVVTDVGGNREVVSDGEAGFLVPPYDSEALAGGMRRMMALGPRELLEMGKAAHLKVKSQFGLAGVVDRWEELYREFLARRGHAR